MPPNAIRLLSQDVAAKIAAGEVVERPANVAKELIENSLDAGASDIEVEIREGGRRLLRVRDNGRGIPAGELALAVGRHATSKLATAQDLDRISSFGFRGEALYSIAAVSRMTIGSRRPGEDAGAELRVEGGSVLHDRPAGLPAGTTVSVENIFFNTPARRKFLRRPVTEAGHIAAIVQRYALAFPACRFRFATEGRLSFLSEGAGRVCDVITKIYGRESARQMLPLGRMRGERAGAEGPPPAGGDVDFMTDSTAEREAAAAPAAVPAPQLDVSGYVGSPSLTRPTRSQIDLFVNGRYVEDRSLTHAVVQAYHTLLPVGRYPLAILFVTLDPAEVDVNVHPRKTEIRFVDANRVFRAVQRAVRQAVVEDAAVPELDLAGDRGPAATKVPTDLSDWAGRRRSILSAGADRQPDLPVSRPESSHIEVEPPALPGPPPGVEAAPAQEPPAAAGASPHEAGQGLPPLRVVGQAGAMYVVAEGPEGLYLIDQHAAHERILYEKFMRARAGGRGPAIASQGLLDPVSLHVGDRRAGRVAEHLPYLKAIGFDVEHFGGDTFLVRAVPGPLADQDSRRLLDEIVQGLAENRDLAGEEMEARLVKMVCKRASIRAGQILSEIEMKELVRQLEQCRAPRTCPHGRPTMLQLSSGELERAFKRT